jgi:hypothetical protein
MNIKQYHTQGYIVYYEDKEEIIVRYIHYTNKDAYHNMLYTLHKEYNKPLPKRKPKVYNPLEIKEDTYDTNICDSFHHSLGPVFYARDYEETEQSDERRGARSEDRTEDEDNRRLRAYTPDFF